MTGTYERKRSGAYNGLASTYCLFSTCITFGWDLAAGCRRRKGLPKIVESCRESKGG